MRLHRAQVISGRIKSNGNGETGGFLFFGSKAFVGRLLWGLNVGLILALTACQSVGPDPESAWERRLEIHRMVVDRVMRHHYSPDFDSRGWVKTARTYRDKVERAGTIEEVYQVLRGMVATLEDAHTFLMTPEAYAISQRDSYAGVGFMTFRHPEQQDLDIVAQIIPSSPAAEAGIERGWMFLNGREFAQPQEEVQGSSVYRFLDHFQRVREFRLSKQTLPRYATERECRFLERPAILYLRFNNFDFGLTQWIIEQLRTYPDARGMILDLRWNPGGYRRELTRLLGCLLPGKRLIGYESTRKNALQPMYSQPSLQEKALSRLPVVVLVSPLSASSAEILAAVLQYHERADIMGVGSTAGEVLFSSGWELPGGALLKVAARDYVDPSGKRLQDQGVIPDRTVHPRSFFELRHGHDPEIDLAVRRLTENIQQLDD